MRLIDADDLHEDFMNDLLCLKFGSALQGTPRSDIDISNVLERIENFPTIDAEPMKHGEWIKDESEYSIKLRCSVCGEDAVCNRNAWGDPEQYFRTDFCPNCGAKMDK